MNIWIFKDNWIYSAVVIYVVINLVMLATRLVSNKKKKLLMHFAFYTVSKFIIKTAFIFEFTQMKTN